VIFVAYEGFELLPYDYDDIEDPRRTLPRALYLSVALVTLVGMTYLSHPTTIRLPPYGDSLADLPDWARKMPLGPKMLWSAVRVLSAGAFRGAGFLVGIDGHDYLVTPHHVARDRTTIEVAIPDAFTGRLHDPVPVTDWEYPFKNVDLMYARLSLPRHAVRSVDLHRQVAPPDREPNLGAELFYVGIFAAPGNQLFPMARSGTLGSPPVEIVKEPTEQNPTRYAYSASLVDYRSYGGFSGSPCYAVLQYANLSQAAEMPIETPQAAKEHDLYEIASLAVLVGMFTAHYDDERSPTNPLNAASRYGIGMMLPVRYIWKALMSEAEKAKRDELDAAKAADAQRRGPTLRDADAGDSEFDRFENLTRQLVNTPKPDWD
jgi:hypothetical protein